MHHLKTHSSLQLLSELTHKNLETYPQTINPTVKPHRNKHNVVLRQTSHFSLYFSVSQPLKLGLTVHRFTELITVH